MFFKQLFATSTNSANGIDRIAHVQITHPDEKGPLQDIEQASDKKSIRSISAGAAVSPMIAASEQTLLGVDPMDQTPELDIDKMSWGPVKREADLYAASEPPRTSSGREAFYQFLRDKKITCLVDLRSADSVNDRNRYYPESEPTSMTFGGLTVTAKPTDTASSGIQVTHLEIKNHSASHATHEQPHEVSVFHFLNWQDFSTIHPDHLDQLGRRLIESEANALVHCKGGIGRTGTLVTYAQVKHTLDALDVGKGDMSRDQIVQAVRKQIGINRQHRLMGCVETPNQFNLIVDTLTRDYA